MKKLLSVLFVIIIVSSVTAADEWYIEEIGSYTNEQTRSRGYLQLDSNNNPYILCCSTYASNTNESWNIIYDLVYGYNGLSVDDKNVPYISDANGNLWENYIRHSYYDGSWLVEHIDMIYLHQDNSIDIDMAGMPYIVDYYYDGYTDAYYKHYYNDGYDWYSETIDDTIGAGIWNSIVVDSLNHIHVAYAIQQSGGDDLYYAYYNGSTWNHEAIESGTDEVGLYASIDVDTNNNPHICYYDDTNNTYKYAYRDSA